MHDICVYTHMWPTEHVGLMKYSHKNSFCFCILYSSVLLSLGTSSSAPDGNADNLTPFLSTLRIQKNITITWSIKQDHDSETRISSLRYKSVWQKLGVAPNPVPSHLLGLHIRLSAVVQVVDEWLPEYSQQPLREDYRLHGRRLPHISY